MATSKHPFRIIQNNIFSLSWTHLIDWPTFETDDTRLILCKYLWAEVDINCSIHSSHYAGHQPQHGGLFVILPLPLLALTGGGPGCCWRKRLEMWMLDKEEMWWMGAANRSESGRLPDWIAYLLGGRMDWMQSDMLVKNVLTCIQHHKDA